MPRIPYKTDAEAGPPDLVAAIRKRRGGRLGALDRLLLYSPPFATGWNEMMGRVRNELEVPMPLRELAMCAVAVLNRAEYELHHHGPIFLAQGGTQAQLDALRKLPAIDEAPFDPTQRAVLHLALEMTRDVEVADATFSAAQRALGDDRHLFELIGVIAAYNMVSRILVAVGVRATD
ncbi:MAG TPA: carboxymuconolactone decarboxylase family protein [Burkholderiaceae bacterium]|jgi:alkylhydroperoxidase family enzyme|nr:carboxymuconolactone decarboxylase family protein [Burkholderiaceae bacterium]